MAAINDGMTAASGWMDDKSFGTIAMTPGEGIVTPVLLVISSSDIAPVFGAAYRADHSPTVEAAMKQWMSSHFGVR
jgi:hypothetical protein